MAWIFGTAARSKDLNQFLSRIAQRAINILGDEKVFPQVEAGASQDDSDQASQEE
jgi:hypothetical protein